MSAERYFHQQRFQERDSIILDGQEYHHLVHVMRAHIGDRIELVNGQGQLGSGTVIQMNKRQATIVLEKVIMKPLSPVQLILVQAIPRVNRLEFILEKGTELGMTEIRLFPSTRSEKRNFTEHQLNRFEGILVAALKQCDRLYLPKIVLMPHIFEWDNASLPAYFGDVSPLATPLVDVWSQRDHQKGAMFCVGPESGFTEEEEVLLKQKGFVGVKLHTNILRTDTAGIAALSIMSQFLPI